jgi:hypothetical protein
MPHAAIGMKILGPFPAIEDADTFSVCAAFRICRREPMKAASYEGKIWKEELQHVLLPMIDSYHVATIEAPENLVGWPA